MYKELSSYRAGEKPQAVRGRGGDKRKEGGVVNSQIVDTALVSSLGGPAGSLAHEAEESEDPRNPREGVETVEDESRAPPSPTLGADGMECEPKGVSVPGIGEGQPSGMEGTR